ncbi:MULTISPECIES: NAD(P)H-dependent oxidoreductase [Cysteiniphilum]|uniref:NAD(P)H-dependent oxidoreductase n=1 Tax=Cysteiniphilum TaxID=2056696 RepID=UPI0017860A57|nr:MULTISPECIES: NAD(P)H-dependent oxidoreductase [Cysteiniphilum]
MKTILIISGSSSKNSINKQLALIAEKHLSNVCHTDFVDLRNYCLPLYSIDIENDIGIPNDAKLLKSKINTCDAILIACPEHNGLPPTIFKNAIDWISRIEGKILSDKPITLFSTSPGKNGGKTSLSTLLSLIPWWGGKLVSSFSLESFYDNFSKDENKIMDNKKHLDLINSINLLHKAVAN